MPSHGVRMKSDKAKIVAPIVISSSSDTAPAGEKPMRTSR